MRNFSIVVSTEQQLNKVFEKALKYGYENNNQFPTRENFNESFNIIYFIGKSFGMCCQGSDYWSITKTNRFDWFSQKKQAKDFMKENIGYKNHKVADLTGSRAFNSVSIPYSKEELFEAIKATKNMNVIGGNMPIGGASKNFINEVEAIRKELFRLDGKPEPIHKDNPSVHDVRSWEDLGTIDGFIVNDFGFIKEYKGANTGDDHFKTAWPTHKQATGSIAMAQLSQLLKDFNKDDEIEGFRYAIKYIEKLWIGGTTAKEFLSFSSLGSAKEFLNRHRKLIETYFNMF